MISQPILFGYAWQRMTIQLPWTWTSSVLLYGFNLPTICNTATTLCSEASTAPGMEEELCKANTRRVQFSRLVERVT